MYELSDQDSAILAVAHQNLVAAMQLPGLTWSRKVTIAKMLHVITRLPQVAPIGDLSVGFTEARRVYGDAEIYFHLTVALENETIAVTYGGHYYHPSTGGDSFTVFRWTAAPGSTADFADFRRSLGVVLRLVDPLSILQGMHYCLSDYEIDVTDDENPTLDDSDGEEPADDLEERPASSFECDTSEEDAPEEEARDGGEDPVLVRPITSEDAVLLAKIGADKLYTKSAGRAYGIEACDGCAKELASGGLFVDGSAGSSGWGNYCSACALRFGVQVGWGKGQLYAQQPDGTWKGVAGFRR